MNFDDAGRIRTGTVWTATAHAVTAVIGSGVLAVPWSVAQMGWIFGPLSLFGFAVITYITARLLCDCYRTPDPVKGQRNHSYMDAVRATLGKKEVLICVFAQYSLLWGTMVGYTITAATSMLSVKRTNCYHTKGAEADCQPSSNSFLLIFGAIHIVLSQLPSLEKVTFLSVIAATMSFCYSFIALYLCVAKFVSNPVVRGTLTGVEIGINGGGLSLSSKLWQSSQALGNIAFSYTYAQLLIEIEDTLKSPPAENKSMKRATLYSIALTTTFYVSLGCMGYIAFGNEAPGNVLTAFHEPFWLVDLANIGVVIHLTAAFQVFAQPIFASYEKWLAIRWPESPLIHNTYTIQVPRFKALSYQFTLCRLLLRPLVVVVTVLTAMMFPFFNAVLGLLGSIAFFPLTVYLPVRMYMTQVKLNKGALKWCMLQGLSLLALFVSLISAVGSVADIADRLKNTKLFNANL
ncbi:amino acid permease 4 [Spinacia oleracea]|uniref:Amino acid permease 4 n=1 Tax=Spinacia oleracea TaxID=3562 RepID=A0A9R0JT65_SPIOL|nr:amino acid permease 4-like [Spinacia oleracea]